MLEALDYSNRRGIIVPMLEGIYKMISEQASGDKRANLPPLPNRVIWKQRMRRELVDIKTRWIFALDGAAIAGFLFFRAAEESGGGLSAYIEELAIAAEYRGEGLALGALIDKFMNENYIRGGPRVFAGERIRRGDGEELLASVGLGGEYPGGYEPLGTPNEAAEALRDRYSGVRDS